MKSAARTTSVFRLDVPRNPHFGQGRRLAKQLGSIAPPLPIQGAMVELTAPHHLKRPAVILVVPMDGSTATLASSVARALLELPASHSIAKNVAGPVPFGVSFERPQIGSTEQGTPTIGAPPSVLIRAMAVVAPWLESALPAPEKGDRLGFSALLTAPYR
jgi:hypothetical protein